jgi:glycosyltransferase involved in cell wall biosynthesis
MKRLFIVSDMIDPSKGSEFRIALKPLLLLKDELLRYDKNITLFVPIRNNNIENLKDWLKEEGILNVTVKAYKFQYQDDLGNHKNKYWFIKDLKAFYKHVRLSILYTTSESNVIFKCGQVNWFFYLLFLIFFKTQANERVVCAPISGFNYIKLSDCIGLSIQTKLYYRFYNLVIWFARQIFKTFYIFNKNYSFLFATKSDCQNFYSNDSDSKLYSEIEHNITNKKELNENCAAENRNISFPRYSNAMLWSGHLVHRKNPILALQIIAGLLEMNKNLTIFFVGEGPLDDDVKLLMNNSGLTINDRFNYIPKLPRLEFLKLIKQVNYVLITSLREVNSMFFLETLNENKFVFALNNSGLQDFNLKNITLIETKLLNTSDKIAVFVNATLESLSSEIFSSSESLNSRVVLEKNNLLNLLDSL